jgi:tetratricopeptide (TPR) repeat protein
MDTGGRWRAQRGLLFVAAVFAVITEPAQAADIACAPVIARVVSIQGRLEVMHAGANEWRRIERLDTPLCNGDRVHTGANSRAALFVQPETMTRVDELTTVTLSQTAEGTQLEFFDEDSAPGVDHGPSCGKMYVITRFPKKFKAKTRYVNAVVEGTEFQLAMRCESTQLAVFEGKVLAEFLAEATTPVRLRSGESIIAGEGIPEAVKLIVNPIDAVQWALYYPPILDVTTEPASADECKSLEPTLSHACFVERADQFLRVGRVDEASEEAQQAITADPTGGEAHAILAIIKVVKNDKAGALEEAKQATEAAPHSMRAWLALSYAHQAHFQLDAALKSAQQASQYAQDSALTHARVAELLMSLGRISDAEKEAKLAVETQPKQSRAHLILGFVHLAQINTKLAIEDFNQAIELDSSDPLARLGLGLARIREGHLKEGREELEIAVGLDPTNSLVRSYVGKAYYEENTRDRDQLAETQFSLAKQYDERDPTPWFYDAILKQTQNRPVEALLSLQKSIELNDNRAVYRSRLLLDEDRATRQVSMARVYLDLTGDSGAMGVATRAVNDDPTNYSAHSFLSDVYARRERYEIARTSEYLQAQLLRPLSLSPVSPQIPYTDLSLPTPITSELFANEYSSMFEGNRLGVKAGGVVGNRDTLASELAVSGLTGVVSGSVGYFTYSTDGFRQNSSISHQIFGSLVQLAPSPGLALQVEYREKDTDLGDIAMSFDPDFFTPRDRSAIRQNSARLGLTYRPTPQSTLLATVVRNNQTFDDTFFVPAVEDGEVIFDDRATSYELQYLHKRDAFSVIGGMGYSEADSSIAIHQDFTPLIGIPCAVFLEPCDAMRLTTVRQWNGYLYANLSPMRAMQITLGVSRDNFRDDSTEINRWNPKAGLRLDLSNSATLRLASFRTLKRSLVTQQTIEPTQVSGFNQLYDDVVGTASKFKVAAIDGRLSETVFAGLELGRQEARVLTGLTGTSFAASDTEEFSTQWVRLNGNWHVSGNIVIATGLSIEHYWRNGATGGDAPTYLRTIQWPWSATLRLSENTFGEFRWTTVEQEVDRLSTSIAPVGRDRFTVIDAAMAYSLPRRKGRLSVEVKNLLNEKFSYQDDDFRNTEPRLSPYLPIRRVLLKVSLAF